MTCHQLFEKQATRSPRRLAVVDENRRLTYGELNVHANRLARHLRGIGVGPESLVAIYLARSTDIAVAILGVLKAGGAWLPLDPAYPKERLAFMVRDSRASVLLTQGPLAENMLNGPRIVRLDAERVAISRRSAANLDNAAMPENLAYVIYTSGSTGQPKGVMLTHAGLCHYLGAMGELLRLSADDVYLHTASIAFSSSVRQLMAPLTHGARVVIASPTQIREPVELFQLIRREGVTILDIVPSYWRSCFHILAGLQSDMRASLLSNRLRLILSASEPLHSDLPEKWLSQFGEGAEMINMFGQTETTGIVSAYPVRSHGGGSKIVPIGRPLCGAKIYLLDDQGRPVADGEVGEIYIGSPSLGRGYWSRSELTAERFIPDPFSGEQGGRLYRTGDLGRCLPDGTITFVGREDQQVKVRGHRVELGEVETVLSDHPGIRQAVVVPHDDAAGERGLVAYLVPDTAQLPSSRSLADFISQRLPDYMSPGKFVFMDALPLTPAGKVDRRALQSPGGELSLMEGYYTPPRTETEQHLCSLWRKLLKQDKIGVHDNFFHLGGQSLLAMQMLSRVRSLFGVKLSWSELFETPTIAELARRIEAARSGAFTDL